MRKWRHREIKKCAQGHRVYHDRARLRTQTVSFQDACADSHVCPPGREASWAPGEQTLQVWDRTFRLMLTVSGPDKQVTRKRKVATPCVPDTHFCYKSCLLSHLRFRYQHSDGLSTRIPPWTPELSLLAQVEEESENRGTKFKQLGWKRVTCVGSKLKNPKALGLDPKLHTWMCTSSLRIWYNRIP